jgi:predicted amidohydrolase YtcJ
MEFVLQDVTIANPPAFAPESIAGITIQDGRITALHRAAVPRSDAPRYRLGSGLLIPGFCDSHVHAILSGLNLLAVNLKGIREYDAVCDALRQGVTNAVGPFVQACGYDESVEPRQRCLDAAELDRICPDRPLVVLRIDFHSAYVNTAAQRRLRLREPGQVRGDDFARAYLLSRNWFTDDERREGMRAMARVALSRGVTSLHCLEGAPAAPDPDRALAPVVLADGPVRARIYLQCFDVNGVARAGLTQIGGCLLLDGSLGSRTAALDSPYADGPGAGHLYHPDIRIQKLIERAERRGMQCAFHAIGPRAIEQVLTAYERVLEGTPRDHRHRIEHFLLPRPDQIERAARLGLCLGMQPAFHHFWGGPGALYAQRVGERSSGINPLRSILAAGIVVGGGSDSDITPLDPLLGIQAAVRHPVVSERLTVAQALDLWISGSRHLGFEADSGRIASGFRADLCWLGADPAGVPPSDIEKIPVLATWVGGVLSAGKLPPSDPPPA